MATALRGHAWDFTHVPQPNVRGVARMATQSRGHGTQSQRTART
jgi:hypothetical protein